MKSLKDSLCNSIYMVSNIEAGSERRQHEIDRLLIEEVSRFVSLSGKVSVTRGEYSTEHRLSVYVISPDDLHRLIQEEAMRLSGMLTRNINVIGIQP